MFELGTGALIDRTIEKSSLHCCRNWTLMEEFELESAVFGLDLNI